MSDVNVVGAKDRRDLAAELTSYLWRKHYCENDVEAILELFDDRFNWVGAAEQEYAVGTDKVKSIFRQFVGKVPYCFVDDEIYDVTEVVDGVYLVTGMAWISTDPETGIYIRVHQRITTVFREVDGRLMCCHIHISNPYADMVAEDVGFPEKLAKQTYDYMQEQIEIQKRKIAEQSAELGSIYNTVPCAIMRFFRTDEKYELVMVNRAVAEMLGIPEDEIELLDWSNGFCSKVVEEDAPAMKSLLRQLRHPGDHVDAVCRIEHPDGETIYINSSNAYIGKDDRGEIIQKIAFDVTDRVMMEEALERKSYEDALTGLYNRTKFNREMRESDYSSVDRLGVAYFDVNGLKAVNDNFGHRAGDDLICRAASYIESAFGGRAYRIGGDEFVVIDTESDERGFVSAVEGVQRTMLFDNISVAVGMSWREAPCDAKAQFEEADKRMYENKAAFYSESRHDRRRR